MVLPLKMSSIIEIAVADLEKAEANPKCRVYMASWFEWITDDVCEVCLAGAMLANQFPDVVEEYRQQQVDGMTMFHRLPKYIREAMHMLNDVRCGRNDEALDDYRKYLQNSLDTPNLITTQDEIDRANELIELTDKLRPTVSRLHWPFMTFRYYQDVPDLFKANLRKIAADLNNHGL